MGLTSSVTKAVERASIEDLKPAFEVLSEADKEKVQEALQEVWGAATESAFEKKMKEELKKATEQRNRQLEDKVRTLEARLERLEQQRAGEPARLEELQNKLNEQFTQQQEQLAASFEEKLAARTKEMRAKADRTFVDFTGFEAEKSNLNTRFYLDSTCMFGGRMTYWTADGGFVLCFHGEGAHLPWAIQPRREFQQEDSNVSVAVCSSNDFEEAGAWLVWASHGGVHQFEPRPHVRATIRFLPAGPRFCTPPP
jgi:TolA-binding protein